MRPLRVLAQAFTQYGMPLLATTALCPATCPSGAGPQGWRPLSFRALAYDDARAAAARPPQVRRHQPALPRSVQVIPRAIRWPLSDGLSLRRAEFPTRRSSGTHVRLESGQPRLAPAQGRSGAADVEPPENENGTGPNENGTGPMLNRSLHPLGCPVDQYRTCPASRSSDLSGFSLPVARCANRDQARKQTGKIGQGAVRLFRRLLSWRSSSKAWENAFEERISKEARRDFAFWTPKIVSIFRCASSHNCKDSATLTRPAAVSLTSARRLSFSSATICTRPSLSSGLRL